MPKSITLRLFLSECVVLVVFFALVIFTFDYVVVEGFAKERLQDFVARLELDLQEAVAKSNNGLTMPYHFREGRFGDIGADLHGFVYVNGKEVWRSASAEKLPAPSLPEQIEPNQSVFAKDFRNPNDPRYVLHKHLSLKNAEDKTADYVITISETDLFANRQMTKLNESLKESMTLLCLALLVVRFLVLRSGLKPIRRIVTDLSAVDEGKKEFLDSDYPKELQGIVSNLNAFINHERVRLERQRNHLADLAHSLKTPLAILRGCTENFSDSKDTVNEQITRMDEIILYQLQRAFAKTEHTVIKQIDINEVIQKIHISLSKVYLEKNIHFDIQLPDNSIVYCEEGDLYEIVGNLMDNACKWCKARVKVSIELNPRKDRRNYALLLNIEDDGSGIPVGKFNEMLKRGTRADENIHGHGIGVSMVHEIIKLLGGKLDGGKSAELGGMHWRIYLP